MEIKKFKKSKFGISLKTSFISGIIVFLFLAVTCVVFLFIEMNLAKIITHEHIKKIEKAIDEQGENQKNSFHQNLMVNAKILGSIASTFLYNIYPDGLKTSFTSCMDLPEILAIKVLDANDKPFFAIWKAPETLTGEKIPDNLKTLDDKFSLKMDSYFEGKKIGLIQIYYTDNLIIEKLHQDKKSAQKEISVFYNTIDKEIKRILIFQIIAAILVVLFLIGTLIIYLKISLIKPLLKIVDFAKNMSSGDLTHRICINQKDEIGILAQTMNKMAEYLSEIIKKNILTSKNISRTTSNLVISLEEASSSLEEISAATKLNAKNAGNADSIMTQVIKFVYDVNESMSKLKASMDEISKASHQASKIIKTINEIAFQTNILSLNASVEAARAGSAGAGFAVVANEVRSLAMRSAEAAKNTTEIIENTIKRVKEGVNLAEVTNNGFKEIGISASSAANLLSGIAAVSKEQADGIEQINKAVAEIDSEIHINAANVKELALSISKFRVYSEITKSSKKR